MKIYFDVCCLNRPFDDQTQGRIRLETEAILMILSRVETDEWQWLSSPAVVAEIKQTPKTTRQQRLLQFLENVDEVVTITNEVISRTKELVTFGFKPFDAFHLACAENGKADVFLTTDDKLLRRANRMTKLIKVDVENPLTWIQERSK
ncbi:MAG: PIN domain-containing protein [Candidatus Promineifilaceae bacterium]